MENTARALIDLGAMRDNLRIVRKLCPRSRILAMLKADAYGHGLLPVARALADADGFGVARLQEARQLRKFGVTQRIVLLPTLLDERDLATCSSERIDVTVHDRRSLTAVARQAHSTPLRVWLKLDSGMHRAGLDCRAFIEADQALSHHPGVRELTHMTHFSNADDMASDMTDRQLSRFFECHAASSKSKISMANSAAIIARPDAHGDWVRPGLMLYGESPMRGAASLPLRAAMTVRAPVIAIREIEAGEGVGYHLEWSAPRRSRIGTLGIGYGDGYPRHARNGTPIAIKGNLVDLVGRVSMDSLAIDLTDAPHVTIGDEATLWGPDLPARHLAALADTIAHELFATLGPRVTRDYSALT